MLNQSCTQQLKQKILKYEIKTIQECTDSLFTQGGSQHQRYLPWQLGETLKPFLEKYEFEYRWIGNDPSAHIYSYFYVVMVGCAGSSGSMLELKLVLYDLSQKYLAQYQQKLLIQFLCLIEYSKDRYQFFRKYQKIQSIFLKIFLQIQSRSQKTLTSRGPQPTQILSNFSQLTTNITSPYRPKEEEEHVTNSILRNSNYYNSSMKRVERQYQKAIACKQINNNTSSKLKYIDWYEVYNKIFYFVKMTVHGDRHVLIQIDLGKENNSQQFIITAQKGCFFVIELKTGESQMNRLMKSTGNRKMSKLEQSQLYLNNLLQKQMAKSKLNTKVRKVSNKSRADSSVINTPKFISRRANYIENKEFYKDNLQEAKSVNVEVLNINEFNESKQAIVKNTERSNHSNTRPLEIKNKIEALDKIGKITSTFVPQDNENDFRSHQNIPEKMEEKPIKTEQNIDSLPICKVQKRFGKTHHRNPESKYSVSNASAKVHAQQKNDLNGHGNRNFTPFSSGTRTPNEQLPTPGFKNIQGKDIQRLYPAKIAEMPSNQIMLSANKLRMSYKHMYDSGESNAAKLVSKARPFHSNSPPNHLLIQNRNKFYSPVHTTIVNNNKIHFTYI